MPEGQRYTYDFDRNSQAIDHILVGENLFVNAALEYEVVHVNSEFAVQTSDHDPQVVRLRLLRPTSDEVCAVVQSFITNDDDGRDLQRRMSSEKGQSAAASGRPHHAHRGLQTQVQKDVGKWLTGSQADVLMMLSAGDVRLTT